MRANTMLSPANLPTALAERIRVLKDGSVPHRGGYILYWMHHAVRAHENPALEVAIHAANRLGLPVLVYQGLGGRHPYNSDRHHTFIMEGAREVQAALSARGISYAVHLARNPAESTPWQNLVRRAALLIAEDFNFVANSVPTDRQTPFAIWRKRPDLASMTPHPRFRSPGSIPIMRI